MVLMLMLMSYVMKADMLYKHTYPSRLKFRNINPQP